MPDYQSIYRHQAKQYDRLVMREDYEHNLFRTLNQIRSMSEADVVELGSGTGRLTLMLAPHVRSIVVSDAARAMLDVAVAKLNNLPVQNWRVLITDNRALPLSDRCADVSIAGWSLGHTTGWQPAVWRTEIKRAIDQMQRVLRPGGALIILETLGTGRELPMPPTEALVAYYAMLENELGFSSTWIRTDMKFESVAEADELTRFFFGDSLADRIVQENLTVLPECTGLWWRSS